MHLIMHSCLVISQYYKCKLTSSFRSSLSFLSEVPLRITTDLNFSLSQSLRKKENEQPVETAMPGFISLLNKNMSKSHEWHMKAPSKSKETTFILILIPFKQDC